MLMLMASCHFLRFMEQTQKKTVRLLRKGKPSVRQLRQSDHTTRAQKGVERKQLCFNCTGANHKAPECRCSACCKFCNQRHHSSICPKKIPQQSPETMLVVTGKGSVTYPVVIVSVGGIHCRALLDTGAGSSYVSAALLDYMGKQPVRREFKRIEMMMQVSNREIEMLLSALGGGISASNRSD